MLNAGTKIGNYEILGSLGAGGMGEVYRGRDTRLNRDVALKVLPESFAADADRLMRFEREAQTLAALSHPHIAAIHGVEESAGVRALVMELVDGDDLSARIARGPMPLDEVWPIAQQIAEALEAAHEAGIVHRDLKPANIKVNASGAVKVLDFGLAKAVEGAAQQSVVNSPTITAPLMTMGGVILGTAAYMAPEQAKGRPVDRRADIWAFGCVLYEMLTGRQAFEGEDVTEILGAIVKTEADWTRLPASTPRAIRTLLKRCLTKDLKRRLQHIGDARIEIIDAASGEPDSPPTATPRARSPRLAWGIAAVLGVLAAVAGAMALRPRPEPLEARLEVSTYRTNSPNSFAMSPDGRSIVFAGDSANARVLWLRTLDSSSARPMPGTENALLPFWSPDGRSIGFAANGQLKRVEVSGGLPRIVAPAPIFRGGAWNHKGDIIFATTNSSGLSRVSALGGDVTPLTTLTGEVSHRWPVFLPDDDHFLYIEQSAEGSFLQLAALSAPTGIRLLASDSPAAFVAPGFILFGSQGNLFAQRFDARSLTLVGERFVAIAQEKTAVAAVSAAADAGTFVYRLLNGSGLQRLSWRDRAGKRLEPLFDFGGAEPELAPDGKRAAVIRGTVGGDNNDVWLVDLARSLATRFTSDPGTELWPAWSPDSSQVAFGKAPHMFVRTLTGAQSTLLENAQLQKYPADWSRDGRFLMFRTIGANGLGDIWALPMGQPGAPFPVIESPFDETRPQFSPDGRWISYESNESKDNEIYLRRFNAAGATIQVSVGGGSEARWHSNGREIFYIGGGSRMMSVALKPSADGNSWEVSPPRELFETEIFRGGTQATNFKFQYAVAPDGQRFLINEVQSDESPDQLIVVLNWKPQAK